MLTDWSGTVDRNKKCLQLDSGSTAGKGSGYYKGTKIKTFSKVTNDKNVDVILIL